jgi:hypothetical protein
LEQVCNLFQRIFTDNVKITNLAPAEKNKKKQSAIPNKPKLVCTDICRNGYLFRVSILQYVAKWCPQSPITQLKR